MSVPRNLREAFSDEYSDKVHAVADEIVHLFQSKACNDDGDARTAIAGVTWALAEMLIANTDTPIVWASEVAEQIKMLVAAHVDMKRAGAGEWQDWPVAP
jgi:hypothetical protein